MHVQASITILRAPDEVFGFWRELTNLPRFMHHLESVEWTGDNRSHWRVKAPVGRSVEWDAEVTEERPGELIAWRSVGGDVANEGRVEFAPAPGDRGTEVRVAFRYDAPGGKPGVALAALLGEDPKHQVADDLRRFKQVLETGEVVRSAGSPEGVGQGVLRQEPSRPARRDGTAKGSRS
jgi:uncharacterized membrane protein